MLSWMFQHDCFDACCFEYLVCMCFVFCICTCSAQLSMFHLERRSRNTLIITHYYYYYLFVVILVFCFFLTCVIILTDKCTPTIVHFFPLLVLTSVAILLGNCASVTVVFSLFVCLFVFSACVFIFTGDCTLTISCFLLSTIAPFCCC